MDRGTAGPSDSANGTNSRLLRDDWDYVGAIPLDDFAASDFALLDAQRPAFTAERQAGQILRIMRGMADDPSFGYRINTYRHCLQSATMAHRAGKDEDYVAMAFLHDIGFDIAPRDARFLRRRAGRPLCLARDGMAARQPRGIPEHALPQPPDDRPLRAGEVARPPGVRDDGGVLRQVRPERDGPGLRQTCRWRRSSRWSAACSPSRRARPPDRAMSWIRRIEYEESAGALRALYDRVKGPAGNIDNVMKAHSLRPHTMEGHSALYKAVLHHTGNTLPGRFLEAVGVYASLINRCAYSVAHHFAGLARLLDDRARAEEIPGRAGGRCAGTRLRGEGDRAAGLRRQAHPRAGRDGGG